ncbi:MAG TPA: response regulator transcription factor [Parafilimonas sp.]|nr:response regulator transcription factor [Parafilimonas sp.]
MKLNTTIRVIIADDHDMFRLGLRTFLNEEDDIEVVAEASDGRKLIMLAKEFNADVIITDIEMPEIDGINAIKQMKAAGLTARCLVLSTYNSHQLIIDSLEAGAMGYIVKNADAGEVVDAVRTLNEHHPYYCKTTNSSLVRKISKSQFNPYNKASADCLNDKEKAVTKLVCQEKTNAEIAKLLFMSARTVEGTRKRIMDRTGVKSTAGLVIYAIKNGIFSID